MTMTTIMTRVLPETMGILVERTLCGNDPQKWTSWGRLGLKAHSPSLDPATTVEDS
jgi:hypothetical protein